MVSFSHILILLLPLSLFLIFLYKWQRCNSHAGKKLPPSPRKLPVIGNLHQVGPLPHRSFQSLSKKHGPIMLLHFGNVPILVVSSAEAAREIMKNQDLIFSNRPKLTIPDRLFYGSKDVAFAPYGEYWRKMKSICVLQLLSSKRVQSFRRVREEETSLMIDNIAKLSSGSNNSATTTTTTTTTMNLSDMLILLMNDVLCRVVLGRKYSGSEEGKEFTTLSTETSVLLGTSCVGDYIPWLAWINSVVNGGLDAKVEKLAKRLDQFLESVLEEHRVRANGESITSKDLVDILLEIQSESSTSIGDDAIKAIILDMFVAGTDTSYTVLEWAMAELLRHPNTMEKLQSEVRRIAGEKEEIIEDDLDKMHYLKAVVKESLRLHAPVPLLAPRESTKDTKVMGYDVAAGTHVIVNAWSIGRDPSLWENPEDFNPERFMDTNIDFKGQHFEFIPFGAGRRGCPGTTFAMSVNELALAKLVHKFNFDLPNDNIARMNGLDVAEAAGLTVRKKFPLLVVATPYTRGSFVS